MSQDAILCALIEHRTTLVKLLTHKMADSLESEIEDRLMLDAVPANEIDDVNSIQSVIMTLEDVEVDPSLLLEKSMQFCAKEIIEVDKHICAAVFEDDQKTTQ